MVRWKMEEMIISLRLVKDFFASDDEHEENNSLTAACSKRSIKII